MPTKTVTVRVPEEIVSAIDSVAELQQRDRSFIINEAVDQYLSLFEYHTRLIEERVRQLDAGAKTIDHETVKKMFANRSKARRKAG